MLRCDVTNNGYQAASVRTSIERDQPDMDGPCHADDPHRCPKQQRSRHKRLMPGIKAGETVEVWVNLSIPPAPTFNNRHGRFG